MMKSRAMLVVVISLLVSMLVLVGLVMMAFFGTAFSGLPQGPLTGNWIGYLFEVDKSNLPLVVVDWLSTAVVAVILVATPFLLRKVAWSRWAAQTALAVLFCSLLLGFIAQAEDPTWRDVVIDGAYLVPAVAGIVALNLPGVRSVSRTA